MYEKKGVLSTTLMIRGISKTYYYLDKMITQTLVHTT